MWICTGATAEPPHGVLSTRTIFRKQNKRMIYRKQNSDCTELGETMKMWVKGYKLALLTIGSTTWQLCYYFSYCCDTVTLPNRSKLRSYVWVTDRVQLHLMGNAWL